MNNAQDPRRTAPRGAASAQGAAGAKPAGKRFKQQGGGVQPARPAARTAQGSSRARSSQPRVGQPTARKAGTHGVAPARRSTYTQGSRRAPQKKSPVPVVIGIVAAIVVIAFAVLFVVPAVRGVFGGGTEAVEAGKTVKVTIPDGASGDTIAKALSDAHVVGDPKDYYAAVKKLNADMSLKPGKYEFKTGQDAASVVQQLMEGPNAGSDSLTIPEGLTVSEVAARVHKAYPSISEDDFKNQAKASNYAMDYSFLSGVGNDSLEGFLCPKTYNLGTKPTADKVIRAMLDQYKKEAKSLDFKSSEAKIKERYGVEMSDYDIINLASIVEREGLNAKQRAHVASVFYNRLAGKLDGQRYLNSDATMMYVTGGEVTADDLQSDSPYNTYKHEGLPPTPICSPSLEAIKATLEPTDSDDLYFYITKDEEHFSKTYEEHQQSWS